MIKFIVKAVIVLLALQAAIDYLRKEEIIKGSIEINYSAIQQKLFGENPATKMTKALVQFSSRSIQNAIAKKSNVAEHSTLNRHHQETVPAYKIVYHVVNEGESLNILSQKYNVHWRVIQKINGIEDHQPLYIGQPLKIPTRSKNLDQYSI